MSWKLSLRTSLLPCWVIVCILISPIHGQVFSLTTCPTLTGATVSAAGVTGTWYEYERTPTIREHYIRCTSYTFVQDAANTRWNIAIGGTNKATGNIISTQGYATYPAGVTVGNWYVKFPSLLLSRFPLTYYVIATDATGAAQGTYMVLFSCTNFKLGTIRSVIVLTSLRFPTQATIDTVNAAVSPYVSVGSLTQIDQTNC